MGVTTPSDIEQSFLIQTFMNSNTDHNLRPVLNLNEKDPEIESGLILIKNLFELREYKKCAFILKNYLQRFPNNQSIIFSYYYSLWMSGLIRKEEEIYENCNISLTQKEQTKYPFTLKFTQSKGSSESYTRSKNLMG